MFKSKMLQEIRQQPAGLERTLHNELQSAAKLRRAVRKKRPRLIMLVARGSSDNAAQFGRYLLEITTAIPVSLAAPSIFTLYKASVNFKDTLVVGISQSGESTDTNLVLRRAKAAGAVTVGITNEGSSSMARLVDHVFLVRAGKEESVAATKTYTGQLLMLYLLAHALGAAIEVDHLRKLPEWTRSALELEPQIAAVAERYRSVDHALVVGRGLNYSNAFEFALKLMETSYVVAERFSPADLLHGPIAMLEAEFPVFLFAPAGVTWPGLAELMGRLGKVRAETLIFTDASNRAALKKTSANGGQICIAAALSGKGIRPADLYTPIPYIVPAQIFAACLAELKGLDPDHPRALTKVTRTL